MTECKKFAPCKVCLILFSLALVEVERFLIPNSIFGTAKFLVETSASKKSIIRRNPNLSRSKSRPRMSLKHCFYDVNSIVIIQVDKIVPSTFNGLILRYCVKVGYGLWSKYKKI